MLPSEPESDLRANLALVRQQLARAVTDYPLPRLIAVTKTHPVDRILPLRALGVTEIGENRVQEIREKLPGLGPDFRVHMIGRLQTNKVKYIIEDVCLIQSVDRMELAREIDRQAAKHNRRMPVLIQVSPVGEVQKGGIAIDALRPFLVELSHMDALDVRGLMAVMPNLQNTETLDALFARMRALFEQMRSEAIAGIRMDELSMGMSHDYVLAARHGATMVRIGSALFGPRAAAPHNE